MNSGGRKKITPWQWPVLNATVAGGGAAGPNGSATGNGGSGPTTTRSSQRQVSYTPAADARTILVQELQSTLGRDPDKKEVEAFVRALHRAQGANPATGTTVDHRDGKGNSSSSSTGTNALDQGAFAQNYVNDTFARERDERASATDYYSALIGLAKGGG